MTPAQTDEAQVERVARAIMDHRLGAGTYDNASLWQGADAEKEETRREARAAIAAMQPSVAQAAKVLLDACPNPIFDDLKYPLMGEFSQTQPFVDENGDEDSMKVTIEWTVIKEIIEATLRALSKETDDDNA